MTYGQALQEWHLRIEYLAQYIVPHNKVALHAGQIAVVAKDCYCLTPLQLRLGSLFQFRFVLVLQSFA